MIEVAILALVVLVILLSLGVPLPYCFGAGLMVMVLVGGVPFKGMMLWGFGQLTTPVLLAIPLFVFAGTIMSISGIASSLLKFINIFIGRVRGGLGVVASISCAVIGAISGSGLTGVAAIGPLLIPEMESKGYPRAYATALIANSSILGLLIPPSVTMIIYGWATETSILASFLATLGPGLLIMFNFSVVNLIMSRKFPLILDEKLSVKETISIAKKNTIHAVPALLMPIIILGSIYGGIMTPTEAAAVAVIYALPVGFLIYRGLTWKNFFEAGKESATAVGAIIAMIFFSLMLSQIFVLEDIPQELVESIFKISQNKAVLLVLVTLFLFAIGMVVNDITAIILTAPLLMPLMGALEVSPIQFAAIMGVTTAMGGVTPPYASILYLGARIGKVSFAEIIKPAMTLIIFGYLPVVVLVLMWPPLSESIPAMLGY